MSDTLSDTGSDQRIVQSLLQRLIYFDIFSYPLTSNEIFRYCNIHNLDQQEGIRVLRELTDKKVINFNSGYYYLTHDVSIIANRLKDNDRAFLRMKTARKYSAIIASFPYVRAVFISGSLSKNVMKPDDDIDFFIITEPGRLWLCRGLLTIFKKVFLGNSHKNFCINYFIDSGSLEIPDKNLFTATEIAFLVPMYNYDLYKDFMITNDWYHKEYPNLILRDETVNIHPSRLKRYFERLMRNRFGDWLDQRFFLLISAYWRKKFFWLDDKTFSQNLRSQKNVSKHHPYSFQNTVLSLYEQKRLIAEVSAEWALQEQPYI